MINILSSPFALIKLSYAPKDENYLSTGENKIRFPADDAVKITLEINSQRIYVKEIDLRDPASWIESLSKHTRYETIKIGPVGVNNIDYPLHLIKNTPRQFFNS